MMTVKKIREEFEAVQISFPDLGSKSDIVKLRGPRDDVEKCGRQLTKMYKELLENNYQVDIYLIEIPILRVFLGAHGQLIKTKSGRW